ncbi:teichoic acid D-Ala incorporation-associated protein DltX [Bacillus sp. RG28]|uniref:Teichoic acid D-Ala incorporation-associated protein DltX n=1 Tax=Gottfriedia endophytica TaxID=2820819 RepID=A0A940SIC0_9BACI|nr:teichoic acid D-Ala incorporation-associated protein DltX [Gottfriedia endophytica]MBP0724336.1 teichoic acid D-Ala incorporation-associated protein DltX [Gottfriedia endophytica]
MQRVKTLLTKPSIRFVLYTTYYISILLGLLYLYGFQDAYSGSFIYNDF